MSRRRYCPTIRLGTLAVALTLATVGCDSAPAVPEVKSAADMGKAAGPTNRLMVNQKDSDVYKNMVGKDGKMLWKQGMAKKAPVGSKP